MGATLEFLKILYDARVEFVVVGGLAAYLHGSARITEDVDVCAPLDAANMERIVRALSPYHPKFRFHPKEPPLPTDLKMLEGFRNLNLGTDIGKLDILGEISGVGTYSDVAQHAVTMELGDFSVRVLDIDALIDAKKAAARLKDKLVLPELLALRDRIKRKPPGN